MQKRKRYGIEFHYCWNIQENLESYLQSTLFDTKKNLIQHPLSTSSTTYILL